LVVESTSDDVYDVIIIGHGFRPNDRCNAHSSVSDFLRHRTGALACGTQHRRM